MPVERGAAAGAHRAPGQDRLHRAELPHACGGGGIDPPETPTFFAKYANAIAAPGAEVALPSTSRKVDYEAEVAFVIGDRCKDVSEDQAMDHVAGYMLLNDLSARDLAVPTPQWMPGKVFDGSAPCGPALVTPDEAGPHDAIEIELRLNGEVMQSASTADLIHSVPALVSHLSGLIRRSTRATSSPPAPRPGWAARATRGCGSSRATRSSSPRRSSASWRRILA